MRGRNISSITRFAVLASAIAARPLTVEAARVEPTHTDGRAIFVAADIDAADVCDAVAVQAALLAGGTLRKDLMMRLARHRPTVAQRYLALEVHRVAEQLDHVLPARTARRMKSTGPQPVSRSSNESLDRALGRERIASPPDWAGALRPSRLRRVSAEDLRASPTDHDLTRLDQLEEENPQQDDNATDETDESKIVNLLSAPGIPNPLGDAIQKLLGMGRSGQDKNQGSAEIPVGKQRFGPVGRNAKMGSLARLVSAVLDPAPAVGTRYPEWDCHKGAYRFDWCAVAEYDPANDESARDDDPARPLLQRPLARVGIEPQRHRRQSEGDSLDLSALVDYETDRRHGDDPEPYIYESSRLTRRDLSVLVLLDCSGSTAEDSGGRVVFEEERRLAGDLTVALERLGDRVGTYGFYSRGKDAVRFLRVKTFNARYDTAAKRRLQSVQPSGFTRIGAAIRHATHVLQSQALAKNMVLLVIGDGLPYDDGYEDRYARADARQAIQEAVLQGIGVAGIGIRSSTEPEVLEDVWSDASFRVIGQCGDIQRHLRGLLLNALSVTRSNGRRRELLSEEHHGYLRSLHAARRSAMNTYS
ncbi:VWA domain-containing protein [Mycobacterium sp. Aquia_216]|uniref:nitric oxide reductase activation protein NorD n=1 Tax=Mycobacterium sp. Aquia_216 TaxID=2991729 RepID=UPI00227BCB09|nr:VWA domain-containing protein [Mycobacterium sp. Aquia_216]WAJ43418.1 VWA domain-containing protein [Mycobacterium sp. Aquia_216]